MQGGWKSAFLACLCLLSCLTADAQDPLLSQYFVNKAYLNPSLTAFEGGMGLGMQYRRQQYQIGGSNVTFTSNGLFAEWDVPCLQSGIGLSYLDNIEAEGYLRWQSLRGSYAWYSRPQPDRMGRDIEWRFGLQATYNWRSLNWDNLVFSQELDAVRGVVGPTNLPLSGDLRANTDFVDLSTGLSWLYKSREKRLQFGLALNHIMKIDRSIIALDDTLPVRATFHATGALPVQAGRIRLSMVPMLRLDIQRGPELDLREAFLYQSLTAGLGVTTNTQPAFFGGAWIRSQRSFPDQPNLINLVTLLGFGIPNRSRLNRKDIRFGLSYDLVLAGLPNGSHNTYELSLSWYFPSFAFRRCAADGKRSVPAAMF